MKRTHLVRLLLAAVTAMTLGAGVAGTVPAGGRAGTAPLNLPMPLPMPVVALTQTQSVRVTAVNLGTVDLTGSAVIRTNTGVLTEKALTLAPGEVAQLTLSGVRRGLDFDAQGRLEVWGELTVVTGDSLSGSLEVFDRQSGTTRALLPANLPEPIPTPLLVSSPMGLRQGQVARVAVVNNGTKAETVSVGIFQVDRVASRILTLEPGQVGWVDLNPARRGLSFDRAGRVQLHGRVACRSLDCLVLATFEGYVASSGTTTEAEPMLTPIQLP